ncbi:hypothetical protein J7E79_00150 [Bacillus sp. ISL-40]|uniref:hypothetical protein n=1 Tax=unclassified Bacillus (in: firmicutes) TaxID=185979 RepID=UPI001BE53C1E|nr:MULTISPECIES: hypothetical protein [unclassified Bacillus (in: firmicutes)]MBT2695859.1 hypothetical protein [Bacillus sp. ISL-40]MBT2743871.1 hypothetical protein [Bacillus sp. ISL-77]
MMKKLKVLKALVSTVALGSLLTFSTTAAFATNEVKKEKDGHLVIEAIHYNPPIEEDFQDVTDSGGINAYYVPILVMSTNTTQSHFTRAKIGELPSQIIVPRLIVYQGPFPERSLQMVRLELPTKQKQTLD